jgi:hypothetical protein
MDNAKNRFAELCDVLEYTNRFNRTLFSIGERICINQERAVHLSQIGANGGNGEPLRPYKIPPNIEKRVNQVLKWIETKSKNNTNSNTNSDE